MSSRERRIDTRVNVNLPLRFRVLNIPDSQEEIAESINISQRGILFATAVPLVVGMPLEVSLKMPREPRSQGASDVKCVARVVHIQANAFLGGQSGIGLHIERYEAGAAFGAETSMALGASAGSGKDPWAS